MCLDEVDETICRGVVWRDDGVVGHLRLDRLGQLLPQLHAPLVVRVDVPDDALENGKMCNKLEIKTGTSKQQTERG